MKHTLIVLLMLLMITIPTGCSKEKPSQQTKKEHEQTAQAESYNEQHEHICVDLYDNEGGCYALMADTKLEYYKDKLIAIYVNDPTVLAFKIPDQYTGGVGVIDGNDLNEIKQKLSDHLSTVKTDQKTEELLSYILQKINDIAIITSAST